MPSIRQRIARLELKTRFGFETKIRRLAQRSGDDPDMVLNFALPLANVLDREITDEGTISWPGLSILGKAMLSS